MKNATACLYSVGKIAVLSSCAKPITTPPTIAPYGLPIPPRITAANIGSSMNQPIFGLMFVINYQQVNINSGSLCEVNIIG